MTINEQTLPADNFVRALCMAEFGILSASVAGQISRFFLGHPEVKGLVPLLYVDYERNIPAFFSMCLLFLASLILLVVTVQQKRHGLPHVWKFATLSFGMFFMSYDEGFQVHENFTMPVRDLIGGDEFGIFYFAWVIPGLIVVCLLLLFFSRFLIWLPTITRNRFLIAGALFVGGSCFVDIAGGYYAENWGTSNWNYSLLATLEEGMEMGGIITFIWALLHYARESFGEIRVRF
jgi:hypothetical protein